MNGQICERWFMGEVTAKTHGGVRPDPRDTSTDWKTPP